jgi:hypothetical protein
MLLVWSMDSGKGDGGLSFWNWDTPGTWSAPRLRKHLPASRLREAHSTPSTNMFADDWRTWVLQATTGFSVYDLDSVASPRLNVGYTIAGTTKGGAGSRATCSGTCATSYDAAARDYSEGAVWFLALAAPYLYVAQADNGLNIYRFTDPANPAQVSWVKRLDRSWFGHRVNQVWVMGNLMVVAAVQGNHGVTLLDISDPANPVKKRRYGLDTTPVIRDSYAWTLNGQRLYNAMRSKAGVNPSGLAVHGLNASTFTLGTGAQVSGSCSTGGYAAVQDNAAHVGLSSCYRKIDVTSTPTLASPAYSIGITGADNDFTTPFGSAVFVGNDHHTTPGSMVLCHDSARDTAAPSVNGRAPGNGATGIKVTTGIGVSFSDNLKQWTIGRASLPVRRRGATAALAGHYSYQLNIVNFRPAAALDRGTTYEVVVTSGVRTSPATGERLGRLVPDRTRDRRALLGDPVRSAVAWSVRQDLQPGATFGGDRAYDVVDVPDILKGRTWIVPSDTPGISPAGEPPLGFDLIEAADVYVCAGDRDRASPAWLGQWTDSGNALVVAGEGRTRAVGCYKRRLPAGAVSLGPPAAAERPYAVVIGPNAPDGTAAYAAVLPR